MDKSKNGQNWKMDKIEKWTKLKIGQNWKLDKLKNGQIEKWTKLKIRQNWKLDKYPKKVRILIPIGNFHTFEGRITALLLALK